MKLGKSVIAVPKEAAGELREFFNDSEWGSIRLHVFSGLLSSEERMRAMMETLERIRLNNQTLKSEIESLRKIISRNQFDSEDIPRAKGVVRAINSLIDLDWTDNNEFSKSIQKEIKPIKGAISEF
ncbi:MAG: hypothetical protein KGY45_01790 [Hadesarchaea archaeon]|nr:hypothetical protein [Hadesarchaea archaeon]